MTRAVLLALASCLGSSALVGAVRYVTRPEMPIADSVRVAIFTRDHADGAPLAADELSELVVPGELASPAWLSPEAAAALLGKPCLVATKGSALTEAHFGDLTASDRIAFCAKAVAKETDAQHPPEVEGVLSAFQRKPEPEREVPTGRVLFFSRAMKAGAVLTAGDLREGDALPEVVTASWISAAHSAQLVGQRVLFNVEAGSPLWWQMVNVAGTPRSCEFEAGEALEAARARAASAWVEKESASW